jgi:Tfp pilus assembly protein PilX
MSLLLRRRHVLDDERGIALVMALGILVVFSITTISLLTYTSSNVRNVRYQTARTTASSLAEGGVNQAMAVLSLPSNNALNTNLLPSTTSTYEGGTAVWSGTLNTQTATWTITSTGRVSNPTGAATVTKTLSVQVPVTPTLGQTLNNQAWNYIYSANDDGNHATCDMTIDQSVNVATPLYVQGDLCLGNTATITKGPLLVKGKLTLGQQNNRVGSSGSPISEAHIGSGCQYKNNAAHNPCTSVDNVFATILDASPTTVSPPTVDWDGWYNAAAPGPKFGCVASRSSASSTWPTFDNDATRNKSVTTAWNLAPSTAYDCWTDGGELKWDPTTKVLTVNGTVFIDGSAYIDNGSVNSYTGEGSLYLSGTFLLKNSYLCAVVLSSGTDCDTANWNPNQKALIIVANGNADNGLPSGDGLELVSAHFQGGVYATYAVDLTTTSWVDGPMVGGPVKLGQSSTTSFPFIQFVPTGTPGNPIVYAQPLAPTGYDS